MQFFEVVERLSVRLNVPELVPGPCGICAVRLDDLVVTFRHDPAARAFSVSSPLGVVNAWEEEPMRALLAERGHAPMRISCGADGRVEASQRFSLPELSFDAFYRALERFVNEADHWRARVRRGF